MNQKKLIISGLAMAISIALNAQSKVPFVKEKQIFNGVPSIPTSPLQLKSGTAIWGAGALVGLADGEFASSFQQSTTSSVGYDPTSWTALTVYDGGGWNAPGNAYWTRSLTATSMGAYAGTVAMQSPSAANGVGLFDSDFMDNGGTPGAFGLGTSPSAHRGELISPRIDLTSYTDTALAVKFFCQWRDLDVNTFSVSMSTDDGATWIDKDIINLFPGNSAEGFVIITFPALTNGVTNLSQCRVKFIFEGYYYFAMIDDVTILTALEHDLTIVQANSTGNLLSDDFEQIQVTNNRYFPISEITSNNMEIGANIKNYGYADITPNDSAICITTLQQNLAGVWTTVHTDTTEINSVIVGSNGTAVIDTLSSIAWVQVGDFRTVYTTSTSKDQNAVNDTIINYFSITADNYASKVNIDVNGNVEADRPIIPAGTSSRFEYGTMFDLPTAGTNELTMDSVSFAYYVPSAYTGATSETIFINIYEWTDANTDGTIDYSGAELTQIGIGISSLTGLGSTIAPGSYGYSTIPNLVNPVTGAAMDPLQDGKIYLVSIALDPSGNGTFTGTSSIWIGASELKNYAMNAALTSGATPRAHPSPVLRVDAAGTGGWNWVGFGADITPSIGLHISSTCTGPTAVFTNVDSQVLVDFTDATISNNSVISWAWDFGDGNTSTLQNPSHTYALDGQYTVCLIANDECSADTVCNTINVCTNPIANFTEVTNNLVIDFTDVTSTTSTTNSWTWDFGDGYFSTLQNPSHTYTNGGAYTVCLTVTDDCGTDSICTPLNLYAVGLNKNWIEDVKIYPIPVKNELNISGLNFDESFSIELINTLGQVFLAKSYSSESEIVINLDDILSGTYQIIFKSDNYLASKSIVIIK